MSLYKRGKIWWLRRDPITGDRRSTQCRDKKAAQLYEADRERLAADPSYAAAHSATVSRWAAKVIALKEKERTGATAKMYRVKYGHIARIFGDDCPMVDVTPKNVDAYIAKRQQEGAVNNTIGKELTAILQMCKLARRAGEFSGDVAALKPVGFSLNYKPRERTLTRSELRTLLANLSPKKGAALALAIATGARFAELPKVTVHARHVDIAGTKTEGAARSVPLEASWQHEMIALTVGHLPVRWPRMSKDLTELAEELELEAVTANDLRRTFATWMIEAGVDRETVAKMLGHRGTQMVFKVYGRESTEALGAHVRRQLERGTETSQSAADGEDCSGRPVAGSSCFDGVAPPGVGPGRPFGPGILNPAGTETEKPIRWLFRSDRSGRPAPDGAYSGLVGTPASQFRELSARWFRRAAA